MTRRLLLGAGAVAAAQLIVVSVTDGATRAGYDPCRNWVSQLVLGPGGWTEQVNLGLCAALLLAYGIGLWLWLGPGWTAGLVVLCGLGFVVVAAVPTDPGLGYPPGVPAVDTLPGQIHKAAGLVVFGAGTAAAVLMGRRIRRPRTGVLVAALMTVSFVAASVLVVLDALGILAGTPHGLLERVALYSGLAWIGGAGLCLQEAPAR